jgi:hypothetical protein
VGQSEVAYTPSTEGTKTDMSGKEHNECNRCGRPVKAVGVSYFTPEELCGECQAQEFVLKSALLQGKIIPHEFKGCGVLPTSPFINMCTCTRWRDQHLLLDNWVGLICCPWCHADLAVPDCVLTEAARQMAI